MGFFPLLQRTICQLSPLLVSGIFPSLSKLFTDAGQGMGAPSPRGEPFSPNGTWDQRYLGKNGKQRQLERLQSNLPASRSNQPSLAKKEEKNQQAKCGKFLLCWDSVIISRGGGPQTSKRISAFPNFFFSLKCNQSLKTGCSTKGQFPPLPQIFFSLPQTHTYAT